MIWIHSSRNEQLWATNYSALTQQKEASDKPSTSELLMFCVCVLCVCSCMCSRREISAPGGDHPGSSPPPHPRTGFTSLQSGEGSFYSSFKENYLSARRHLIRCTKYYYRACNLVAKMACVNHSIFFHII